MGKVSHCHRERETQCALRVETNIEKLVSVKKQAGANRVECVTCPGSPTSTSEHGRQLLLFSAPSTVTGHWGPAWQVQAQVPTIWEFLV